jgi:hypothetical protein
MTWFLHDALKVAKIIKNSAQGYSSIFLKYSSAFLIADCIPEGFLPPAEARNG